MKKDIKTGNVSLDKSNLDPKNARLHFKIELAGDVYLALEKKITKKKTLSDVINQTLRKSLKK